MKIPVGLETDSNLIDSKDDVDKLNGIEKNILMDTTINKVLNKFLLCKQGKSDANLSSA